MGGFFSSIGNALGGLAKGVGQVAGIAAPFLPGPWGAVAGALGSLSAGADSQRRANQAQAKQQGAINDFATNARGYLIDPAALYNPALALVGQNNAALYQQGIDATDPAFDAAAQELGRGAMDRGVGGGAITAALANLRAKQAIQSSNVMRDIGINNTQQRMGLYGNIADATMRRNQMGLGAEQAIMQAQLGHLGGLQGMYQSQANQTGSALGQLGGALGQTGAYDWIKGQMGGAKKRTGQAGGSTTLGSTLAQKPSPPSLNTGFYSNTPSMRVGSPQKKGLFSYG